MIKLFDNDDGSFSKTNFYLKGGSETKSNWVNQRMYVKDAIVYSLVTSPVRTRSHIWWENVLCNLLVKNLSI